MPTSDQGVLAAGAVVAGCRVVRLLGKGGMGEVYLAHHLRLDKPVAVKVLPPAFAGTDLAVPRFLREARLAARISHPNVIKILDVGRDGDGHFILMDYVEGANLTDLVRRQGGPLPWRQALRLVQLAARGVGAVHKHGLIHRDIKPANIMLSADRQVLLMDFGLAREVDGAEVTRGRAVLGTPAFMSPEQARAERLDRRSDVFSLGSTLYYLLAARYPFEGNAAQVTIQVATGVRPAPVREVNSFVPEPVSAFVARLMAPDKADRPADTAAVDADIRHLLALPDAPPTPGGDTADGSGHRTGPSAAPDADLVPLETVPPGRARRRRVPAYLPWALGGAAAFLATMVVILLATRGRNPAAPPEPTVSADPAPRPGMVYVRAGKVQIGNTEDELRRHFRAMDLQGAQIPVASFLNFSTHPPRTEDVPAFQIDRYEVTMAEYAVFVEKTGHPPPKPWEDNRPPAGREQHPVTFVTHADATAYAAWAGKKLPTERQWVRAFRDDTDWHYPWGSQWEPRRAVVYENTDFRAVAAVTATPDDRSPFGVVNLAGNVAELMRDPVRRDGQEWFVAHGPDLSPGDCLRAMAANYRLRTATAIDGYVGFRCVAEAP